MKGNRINKTVFAIALVTLGLVIIFAGIMTTPLVIYWKLIIIEVTTFIADLI